MKSHSIIAAAAMAILAAGCKQAETPAEPGLKDVFGDKFLIGAAINVNQSNGTDTLGVAAIKKHFNAIVAENCMKCEEIHPAEANTSGTTPTASSSSARKTACPSRATA